MTRNQIPFAMQKCIFSISESVSFKTKSQNMNFGHIIHKTRLQMLSTCNYPLMNIENKKGVHNARTKRMLFKVLFLLFSSSELSGSQGELIVYPCTVVCLSVRPSVRSHLSNIFSSKTAWPIKAKFYVEPPWVGGTKILFTASWSCDQDGRHAHIW